MDSVINDDIRQQKLTRPIIKQNSQCHIWRVKHLLLLLDKQACRDYLALSIFSKQGISDRGLQIYKQTWYYFSNDDGTKHILNIGIIL